MKTKHIFNSIGLALVIGLSLTACSQSEDFFSDIKPEKIANGFYVYPAEFDCQAPSYQEEGATRAVTYNWQKGATIFMRMKSNSGTYPGFYVKTDEGWDFLTANQFELNTINSIELYYFQDTNGNYYHINLETQCYDIYNNGAFVKSTSIKWNAESVDLSEATAVYSTSDANFSILTNRYVLKATLNPALWRIRFNGTNGTSITLPADDNDIKYCSGFKWLTDNVEFTKTAKDVSLTVNGNYTPYIFGEFNSSSLNKITVKNNGDFYTRDLNASYLKPGASGFFTLPTSSNYSNHGWIIKSTEMILKDMLEKPLGTVNANLKTDPYQAIRDAVARNYKISEYTSDDGRNNFYLYLNDNPDCSNMKYQGIPFSEFNVYESEGGISIGYHFIIEKGKMSGDYKTYYDKIIQDFINLNVSFDSYLTENTAMGYDQDNNFCMVIGYEGDDICGFIISVSYISLSEMVLKDMLERPLGTVNVNMKAESYQTIRDAITKSYIITDYTTNEGKPWFTLKVEDNNCKNLKYHGLSFDEFNIFEWDDGIGVYYYFLIDKTMASNNYKSYLDKILQDCKNLNISLDNKESSWHLADYSGYDTAMNYHSVTVNESGNKYEFIVYVNYKSSVVIIWQGEQSCSGFDGSSLRFSDSDGNLPTLSDETYEKMVGKKMCLDIKDVKNVPGYETWIKVTNGWWSEDYVKETLVHAGDTFEFVFTQHMADQCKKGGEGKDLMFISNNGLTISKFYYKP